MAADKNRRAGLIWVQIDGRRLEAKGSFTIQPGRPLRNSIIGADGVHGYAETAQAAYIERATTDHPDLDTVALRDATGLTVTLELNNGKTWVLEDAWFAGEGAMSTEESEIGIRFESKHQAQEIKS